MSVHYIPCSVRNRYSQSLQSDGSEVSASRVWKSDRLVLSQRDLSSSIPERHNELRQYICGCGAVTNFTDEGREITTLVVVQNEVELERWRTHHSL